MCRCVYATEHVEVRGQPSGVGSLLYNMGPRAQTPGLYLISQYLNPRSHLASPWFSFYFVRTVPLLESTCTCANKEALIRLLVWQKQQDIHSNQQQVWGLVERTTSYAISGIPRGVVLQGIHCGIQRKCPDASWHPWTAAQGPQSLPLRSADFFAQISCCWCIQ